MVTVVFESLWIITGRCQKFNMLLTVIFATWSALEMNVIVCFMA
jgi:hypothetical protein